MHSAIAILVDLADNSGKPALINIMKNAVVYVDMSMKGSSVTLSDAEVREQVIIAAKVHAKFKPPHVRKDLYREIIRKIKY